MMISPENLKAVKNSWVFNGEIVESLKDEEPCCPICGTQLIRIKKYVYKGNCEHISKNLNIGFLGNGGK